MVVQNPMKHWMQLRKKHYQRATVDYLERLREALAKKCEQKLQRLKSRTLVLHIENPAAGSGKKIIQGLTIRRGDLPTAKLNEKIALTRLNSNEQVVKGYISSVNLQHIRIKLERQLVLEPKEQDAEGSTTEEYIMSFDSQDVSEVLHQVERALERFKSLSCSLPLHKCLLGNFKDCFNTKYSKARVITLEGLTQPKGLQVLAVEQSMRKRISLIEGVAGSGKTLVAANIACSMNRLRGCKILLCSPLQATVDKLVNMIACIEGLVVVKLTDSFNQFNSAEVRPNLTHLNKDLDYELFSRSIETNKCDEWSLDILVDRAIYRKSSNRLKRAIPGYCGTRRERSMIHQRAIKIVQNSSGWLRLRIAREILLKANVVCCTLAQVSNLWIKGLRFHMLIIDDVQIASELESLVPLMTKGLKQVTLLSDVRRDIRLAKANGLVSRTNSCKTTTSFASASVNLRTKRKRRDKLKAKKNFSLSEVSSELIQEPGGLFERLLSIGLAPVALKYQYRMHETLAAFSSHQFYLSRLKTDSSINATLTSQICNGSDPENKETKFNWLPRTRCLTAIFNTANDMHSLLECVRSILDNLVQHELVNRTRIGIITNHRASTCQSFDGVDMGTVEDFVGQEKDFIILLTVDSKPQNGTITNAAEAYDLVDCNYLRDDNSLNIAITRARLGLFIVADLKYACPRKNCHSTITLDRELAPHTEYCKSWRDLVGYYIANNLVMWDKSSISN